MGKSKEDNMNITYCLLGVKALKNAWRYGARGLTHAVDDVMTELDTRNV